MCYTGTCRYESCYNGVDCDCKRGSNPCPMEGVFCPQCGSEMMESLRAEGASGSYAEVQIWYCEKCEYQEDQ